ncbi:MAG: TonB-dependent receptor plug domain-containing protein [Candidatus Didemnitutus sp.]|nr:TonB-dependent receptor plug domain-containing protein [Candidatus Didemnitutus sp.]
MELALPAQRAADALLAFSQQAKVEVLYPFDQLQEVQSQAVAGRLEAEDALTQLLRDTGFIARRTTQGKFVVTKVAAVSGAVRGRFLLAGGAAARDVVVAVVGGSQSTRTDERGEFLLAELPVGTVRLQALAPPYREITITGVKIEAGQLRTLEAQVFVPADDFTKLDPFVVQGNTANLRPFDHSQMLNTPRVAAGNLDLPRSENAALPFVIYDRDQITRSGVVDLNEFLQRSVIESSAGTLPPEQDGSSDSFTSGSVNLNLRAYGSDATVVLVNGRRLPEGLTNVGGYLPPDVNLIPLSLVQQVEVLPVSASALFSGNAVGGVINIVLRPEADANSTEITTTFTNALGRFDAPQIATSILHSRALLDGRLRVRANASFTRNTPPTEAELGHRQRRAAQPTFAVDDVLYRATPNVRSADGSPLFGALTPSFTSVAPGADGNGGAAAFAGREGKRSQTFFDSPGDRSVSPYSFDYPYGRHQTRAAFAAAAVYDLFPWLQLGFDGVFSRTVVNRGLDVLTADLALAALSPFNPFGRDVLVSLNETAPALGQNFSEARTDFESLVLGAVIKLPSDWRVTLDGQYGRNVVDYRGLAGVDAQRWQQLVDQGVYHPLRDTQVHGPPAEFYERALLHYGTAGRFVTLGDYQTLDGAVRIANQALELPTGTGVLNFGFDYRRTELAGYRDEVRYADGTLARTPEAWLGRTLQRLSVFGELQGPALPTAKLPDWIRKFEADLAVRYIAADTSRETNIAPTLGLKLDFGGGLSFRSSVSTSNRVPTPQMSRRVATGGGGGLSQTEIDDPVRRERYPVFATDIVDPNIVPEAAITQTAGLIYQTGKVHRLRAGLDFVDTHKDNEVVWLEAQQVVTLEAVLPDRIERAALNPGDSQTLGRITSLLTGPINAARRHSQNWNATLDYAWMECGSGSLELRGRVVYFQKFDQQLLPLSETVDQLEDPNGLANGLLRYRALFGATWANRNWGTGVDGHYFHSRILPRSEQASQGSSQIKAYWQLDAHVHADLSRWLPGQNQRYGLRAQLRVNNVFDFDYPRNTSDPSGVQPYGDWRGRTYSFSLTASF